MAYAETPGSFFAKNMTGAAFAFLCALGLPNPSSAQNQCRDILLGTEERLDTISGSNGTMVLNTKNLYFADAILKTRIEQVEELVSQLELEKSSVASTTKSSRWDLLPGARSRRAAQAQRSEAETHSLVWQMEILSAVVWDTLRYATGTRNLDNSAASHRKLLHRCAQVAEKILSLSLTVEPGRNDRYLSKTIDVANFIRSEVTEYLATGQSRWKDEEIRNSRRPEVYDRVDTRINHSVVDYALHRTTNFGSQTGALRAEAARPDVDYLALARLVRTSATLLAAELEIVFKILNVHGTDPEKVKSHPLFLDLKRKFGFSLRNLDRLELEFQQQRYYGLRFDPEFELSYYSGFNSIIRFINLLRVQD